ncbi:hypothetical protein EOL70_10815 [Leucothrix sargassi]|nr:hypothetical protein EOL70_10815 [Leucothrix sargassi]
MNGYSRVLLFSFLALSSSAFAATDTKYIKMQVTQGTFAELTGSAIDGKINTVTMTDIDAKSVVPLGTLGVKSNGDDCSIKFSTLNNFSLLNYSTNKPLTRYRLGYLGHNIASNADQTIALNSCSLNDSLLTFAAIDNLPSEIDEAWYQDRVTITLTAE